MRKHSLLFVSRRRQVILSDTVAAMPGINAHKVIKRFIGIALVCLCFAAQATGIDQDQQGKIKYITVDDKIVAVTSTTPMPGGNIAVPATSAEPEPAVDFAVANEGTLIKYTDGKIVAVTSTTSMSGGNIAIPATSAEPEPEPAVVEFEVANGDGILIKYLVTATGDNPGDNTVAVIWKDGGYIGDVVIPSTVSYEGADYNVTGIESGAFYYCRRLTSITIPEGVISIGERAFEDCSNLTAITVENANPNYASVDGVLFNKSNTQIIQCPAGKAGNSYDIPEGVTSIGSWAFSGCTSFTSITIPNSVTSIGYGAFFNCSSLNSITIPDGVTSIGNYAFSGCSNLATVTIGNSVTSIGSYAFSGCSSLNSITIPEGVTAIGESAFVPCGSLTSITVVSGNPNYASEDGVLFSLVDNQKETLILYPVGKAGDNYTIPDGVTSIGYGAFSNCSSLNSITIPDGVTSIGNYAFSNCSSLNSITIPDGVTSIGNYAFSDCSNLATVTIGNSVTSIGISAFSGCSSLNSITIPEGVTAIGESAFMHCGSLTSITVVSGNPNYASEDGVLFSLVDNQKETLIWYPVGKAGGNYTIPDGVTSIGYGVFSNCSSLNSITIPGGVTSIGRFAFANCSSLNSITIPGGVTSIGHGAFSLCGLTSITIPNSVTSIGELAFTGCGGLTSFEVEWATPLAVTDFQGEFSFPYSNCILIVPVGKVELYRDAEVWKQFATITEKGAGPLLVEPESLSFGAYGTVINVTVTPEAGWSVSAPEWLRISYPAAGEDWSFTVTADANPGAARKAMIIVSNSSTNRSIPASQSETSFVVDDIRYTATTENTVAASRIWGVEYSEVIIPPTVNCEENGVTYSVTSIESFAFGSCSSLTAISIPNSVTSIEWEVFYGCSSLATIEVEWATPLNIYYDLGGTDIYSNCTLVVPVGRVQAYKDAQIWGNFAKIEEASLSVPTTLSVVAAGETKTIAVTSNVTWKVSTTDSWLSVTKGSGEITATASANSSTSPRTATITVSGGGLSREISVTQAGETTSEPETPEVPETPSEPEVPETPPVIAPTGVSLDLISVTLKTGETQQLVPLVRPLDAADKSVTWTSSNTAVATVSGGVVTAVAAGTATITVTTAVGGYKATCTVTVTGSTTGIAKASEGVAIRSEAGRLYVNSPAAETVYIYSFNGKLLYTATKASGLATFDAPSEKLLIVRGTSGWAVKLMVNY